jgi:DNA-binding NtrC family response regulator
MAKRILVVDDEPLASANVSIFLHQNGFEVDQASDGKQALALLAKERFDLVISDLRMPRVNGLLLKDVIQYTSPKIPVLLMTGYYGDLVTANLERESNYVVKPILLDELLSKVQKLIGKPLEENSPPGSEGNS